MNELQAIVAAAETSRQNGVSALLATVVRVAGSAYRRPGARMLLTPNNWLAGSISGGCLEADILRKAWWRTRTGERIVVAYDSRISEDDEEEDLLSWGFGLGCNGLVEVLLERVVPGAADCPVAFIAECLQRNVSGVLATVIRDDSPVSCVGQRLLWREGDALPTACTVADPYLASKIERDLRDVAAEHQSRIASYSTGTGESVDVFLECITPPRPLVICGAGHDAVPLTTLAKTLGWHVTVVDPRTGVLPRPERFPGADVVLACAPSAVTERVLFDSRTCVVVMSHNVQTDATVLAQLLPTSCAYIGVLGPKRRTERLLAEARDNGVSWSRQGRLYGPVGLDIGADTPEVIALSILAEIQTVLAGRTGGFLRDRETPIHDPVSESSRDPASSKTREPVQCALASASF